METYYLAVKDLIRDNCHNLNQYYSDEFPVPNKSLKYNEGKSASVYDICKEKDCKYVLKVIVYDHKKYDLVWSPLLEKEYIERSWINEVNVLKKLNKCQDTNEYKFVPEIYDYWYCENKENIYFYILMEKFEGNLYDFVKKYKGVDTIKIAAIQSLALLESLLFFIHTTCDVCLNDIKLENILYKQVDKYIFEFVFADTGNSSMTTDDKCKKDDTDRFRRQIKLFKESL